MQSLINDFFHVIDRDTEKLLSAETAGRVTWAERIARIMGRPRELRNSGFNSGFCNPACLLQAQRPPGASIDGEAWFAESEMD
jgi:hypothetical protein